MFYPPVDSPILRHGAGAVPFSCCSSSQILLVVGLDSALIGSLTGGLVSPDGITALLAFSPNSAYRSLVFALSVAPTGVSVPAGPTVLVSSIGLVAWLVAALGSASLLAWR